MPEHEIVPRRDAAARGEKAAAELSRAFEEAGWRVRSQPGGQVPNRPDMIVRRGHSSYAVEVKAAAEGRSDRLIPLWSQAYLQALHAANGKDRPLAVVAAPRIAPRAADQIMGFIAEFAPDAAAGVFDFAGLRRFRGPGLADLESGADFYSRASRSVHHAPADIFSDLNQWMLKVLLAPDIPEKLLSAPRDRYRDASHLARSAQVSVMSASRFVRQLEHEGYLDRAGPFLRLVRRRELFRRWQASSDRRVKEVPMRFVLRGDPKLELRKMMRKAHAALALFSAAEALRLGFVHGVPPYVYLPRLDANVLGALRNVVPIGPGEQPDLIVRQAPAVQSVFRGIVQADDVPASDVLQVWLDVSSHPSRGKEQAEFIRKRVLARVINGEDDG